MSALPKPEEATAHLTDYVLTVPSDSIPATVRREGLRSFVNILGMYRGWRTP